MVLHDMVKERLCLAATQRGLLDGFLHPCPTTPGDPLICIICNDATDPLDGGIATYFDDSRSHLQTRHQHALEPGNGIICGACFTGHCLSSAFRLCPLCREPFTYGSPDFEAHQRAWEVVDDRQSGTKYLLQLLVARGSE